MSALWHPNVRRRGRRSETGDHRDHRGATLFVVAAVAMVAAAAGELCALLSTALWLPSVLALACDPSSPIRRAARRGLNVPVERPAPEPERPVT